MRRLTTLLFTLALGPTLGCNPRHEAPAAEVERPLDAPESEVAPEEGKGASSSVEAPTAMPEASAEAEADRAAPAAPARRKVAGLGGLSPAPRHPSLSPPVNADVRAGEWDDNANYHEFQRFLSSSAPLPFHQLDLSQRRFIVVRDNEGKGVPSCQVVVSDGQHQVRLTTTASGRAILFPRAEGLSGWAYRATARCGQDVAQRRFSLQSPDGVVDLQLETSRRLPAQKLVDVAFILDTTGSMSEEIAAVKATIQKVATQLTGDRLQLRLGLVEYKDRTDSFATKVYPMSRDLQGFSASVAGIRATGGGDLPEDAVAGLKAGVHQLDWDDSAVARVAFMIGDAPPHLDYQGGSAYERLAKDAAHRGIKVYTIAASGMDDLGQVVWRQIAQYTGATNMFVLRGGAGPQSTGGGDPKSSCGGTHQNYSSGNLDALIANKVRREIRALEADPMAIAGLGQDERAKPCNERVAQL